MEPSPSRIARSAVRRREAVGIPPGIRARRSRWLAAFFAPSSCSEGSRQSLDCRHPPRTGRPARTWAIWATTTQQNSSCEKMQCEMVFREHENAAHEPHRIRPRLDRWLDAPNEARYERVFGDYSSVHARPHTQTFAREPLAPSSGRRVSRGRHGVGAVPAPIASHCSQDPGRARCKSVGRRGVRGGAGGDGPGSRSRSRR